MVNRRILKLIATTSAVAGALSLPGLAHAANIRVNSLDGGSVAGACTITDAVAAANNDAPVNGCAAGEAPGDLITFDVSGTVPLTTTLMVSSNVIIDARNQNVTLSGGGTMLVFSVSAGASLDLWHVTVASGADLQGGGLQNYGLTVIRSSTFAFNSGLFIGAINNEGVLIVMDSAFYGNRGELFAYAGAIRNNGGAQIANSTISGNVAAPGSNVPGGGAGGIGNTPSGHLTIVSTTFSGNSAQVGALNNAGTVLIGNTLMAHDSGECASSGSIVAIAPNFVADGSCSLPGALSGDAKLGPLADNGGDTFTHALLDGSPAIDAGDDAMCAVSPVSNRDQRGQIRPYDGNDDGMAVCDIGSYERGLLFPFSGFLAPVDPLPVVNLVKAGRAIPIKFSLEGDHGLNIFAGGSPASQQITCDTESPLSDVEQTLTAGGSSLTYDAASDTYTYVWKTSPAWAGTCRQFALRLIDGSSHVANFWFK